jgi:hypothetical protein
MKGAKTAIKVTMQMIRMPIKESFFRRSVGIKEPDLSFGINGFISFSMGV